MRKANEIKIVRLVKRRADLSLAQFKNYWLTRHAEHERRAIEATPLQKVVASIATGEVALGGTVPPFDGMVSLYFKSIEDARATVETVLRNLEQLRYRRGFSPFAPRPPVEPENPSGSRVRLTKKQTMPPFRAIGRIPDS